MFDPEFAYKYNRVGDHSGFGINRKHVQHLTVYSFRSHSYPYLIEVERYAYDIHIIKFYRRLNKGNKERFSLLSNEGRCSRIIATCFSILMDIHRKNSFASFGFIGAHNIDKATGEVEDKSNTKRFKVYERAVANCFGEQAFFHSSNPSRSAYLAISRLNGDVNLIEETATSILDDILGE